MGNPERDLVAGTLALMMLKTLETVEFAWRDLRFACRLLRRQPLFAAAAIVTVALGVGANTAVVSALEVVLLGLRRADRVMAVRTQFVTLHLFHAEKDYCLFKNADPFRKAGRRPGPLFGTKANRGIGPSCA
jgi:hypothetical protein